MNAPRTTRKLVRLVILFSLMSAISGQAQAQAAPITADTLTLNCQELIAIYDKKGKRKLMASISTSVAEAMRAGICRGMIEEHGNHNTCDKGWHDMASSIVEMDSFSNVENMLDSACGY